MYTGKHSNHTLFTPVRNYPERVLSIVPEGVCLINNNRHILYFNEYCKELMEKYLGYVPKPGQDLLHLLPNERKPIHEKLIKEAFQGKNSSIEFTLENIGLGYKLRLDYLLSGTNDEEEPVVCLLIRDISESAKLKAILEEEKKHQHTRLLQTAIEAEEKQRTQIGRELHDNVNQVLTTIKLYAELCLENHLDQKELLGKIVVQSNYCIEEIRNLSRQLSSPDDNKNLEELMTELVESIRITQKILIRFRTSGIREKPIRKEIQKVIYRITQEQITNILKYAEASIIDIILVCYDNAIALQIEDNGKGFEWNPSTNNSGLNHMTQRTELVGGSIQIKASPGAGCTIIAEFPIQ